MFFLPLIRRLRNNVNALKLYLLLRKENFMSYNKSELLSLPLDERRELASDLLDSILVDEFEETPDWKKKLIEERIKSDNENPDNGVEWDLLKSQYLKK